MSGVHASERLSFMHLGKASSGKPTRKPESGNPTFRDCRGASGDVTLVELGTHLATERAGMVTLHLTVGAPELYPDQGHGGIASRQTQLRENWSFIFDGSPTHAVVQLCRTCGRNCQF